MTKTISLEAAELADRIGDGIRKYSELEELLAKFKFALQQDINSFEEMTGLTSDQFLDAAEKDQIHIEESIPTDAQIH